MSKISRRTSIEEMKVKVEPALPYYEHDSDASFAASSFDEEEESLFSFRSASSATTAPSSASTSTTNFHQADTSDCCCDTSRLELRTPTFSLPLELPRPDHVRGMDYCGMQLDDSLADVPLQYVLDQLRHQGPSLLNSVTETLVACPPSTSALPPTMPVYVPSSHSLGVSPNYVLAMTSNDNPRTLLLPVHGLVLASNCTSLFTLARSCPKPIPPTFDDAASTTTLDLAVVHIHVPSSAAFALLTPYFYTSSASSLLASLLPLSSAKVATGGALDSLLSDTPNVLAARLAGASQKILMERVNLVHQCWTTAVALGAGRDELWKVLEVSWAVLVGALAIQESKRIRKEQEA